MLSRFLFACGSCSILVAPLLSPVARAQDRSYDGTGNNLAHPTWGSAGSQLVRMAPSAYDDGFEAPRGSLSGLLPNPRLVSNTVLAQSTMLPNTHAMTGWVFQWGQFIDHDLDLSGPASPDEHFDIAIPTGDPIFDLGGTGTATMSFRRSIYDTATGLGPGDPRQQINEITSYLDASVVYGSVESRADALREGAGGRLLTSSGNLLPLNTLGLANDTGGPADPTQYYVAGDVRVNEQVGLTAVQTLFMREHNRLASQIATANPTWGDELIYQRARKLVGAEVQAITYNEFLPALLGPYAPSAASVYDPNLDATILNEFSTVLFRVGHTMLPPQLMRMADDGTEAPGGHMSLRHAFFLPQNLAGNGELEYFLMGLASDEQQEVDMRVIDDVRNFLFGDPIPGGLDLASLNIQRGRDHGLPDYNTLRVAFGLPAVTSFAEITSDTAAQAGLQSLYGDVDTIDAWVGALAEDHLLGAAVGPMIAAGLIEQFTRLKDGDRFWYLRDPELTDELAWLETVRLSDVIRWNTSLENIQSNVFFMAVPEPTTMAVALIAIFLACLPGRRRGTKHRQAFASCPT